MGRQDDLRAQASLAAQRAGKNPLCGPPFERALASLRRARSIHRIQRNRDANEHCDLGGEA